jgi:hypothetical protein
MVNTNYKYNVPLPTPTNGGELNKAERERLKDVPTSKIMAGLQDPNLSPALRKQYVAELRARVNNDKGMDAATKAQYDRIMGDLEKGPVSADDADKVTYGLDQFNDEELREDGLAPHQYKLGSQEEVDTMSDNELTTLTIADMSAEDRKKLAAELRERGNAKGLENDPAFKAMMDKLEGGQKLSLDEFTKLETKMRTKLSLSADEIKGMDTGTLIREFIQNPDLPQDVRDKSVEELRYRLKNDPNIDAETKAAFEHMLDEAKKGPLSKNDADVLGYGINYWHDKAGSWPLPSDLPNASTNELIDKSVSDLSHADMKRLGAEVSKRADAMNLSPEAKAELKPILDKMAHGDRLSVKEHDTLEKHLLKKEEWNPDDPSLHWE